MTRRYLYWITALMALLLCTACGAQTPVEQDVPNTPPVEEQPLEEEMPPAADPAEPTQEETETPPDAPTFDFAQVADLEFTFSSGAGAWRTVLYIHEDGSFDGLYSDSEMGDFDAVSYPNGTYYVSEFSGRFTQPEQVDDYTWRMQVAELHYARPFGEEVANGIRYIYTEAFGINGAENLYLYLPGSPLEELPEAYRTWVGYYNLENTTDTVLPFHGLYNETADCGFSSYSPPSAKELVQQELEWAESAAAELETALENAGTQFDMNQISGELYKVWDAALNSIWHLLKDELNEANMAQLTAEQLHWISEKESAVAAAGGAYEGGSIYALVVNRTAADWTAQRTRELAAYLQ